MTKTRKLARLVFLGAAVFSLNALGKEKTCVEECKEETAICVKMCSKGAQQKSRGGETSAAIAKCKEACKEAEDDCRKDCADE